MNISDSDNIVNGMCDAVRSTFQLLAEDKNRNQINLDGIGKDCINKITKVLVAKQKCELTEKAALDNMDAATVQEFELRCERDVANGLRNAPDNNLCKEIESILEEMKCILPTQPVKRQAANNSVIVDNEVDFTETISDIDPISKRPFKEPVKNTVCGHIYDKDSIKQLIALGNRVRCPVVGCSNRSPVQLNNLIVDEDFKRRLEEQRNNRS